MKNGRVSGVSRSWSARSHKNDSRITPTFKIEAEAAYAYPATTTSKASTTTPAPADPYPLAPHKSYTLFGIDHTTIR